jgi:uncharacterized protein YndB with AHSA1/START domain
MRRVIVSRLEDEASRLDREGRMTSLTLVRRIAARPSIVFEALTTADGIAAWWGPVEIEARVGGAYRVRFRTEDGREHEVCGECLEVIEPVRLVMSYRWALGGEPEEFGRVSRIEFVLRPIEGGTELTFTHADLKNAASQTAHGRGWTGALARLERYVASVPLERRPDSRSDENVVGPVAADTR